MKLRLFSLIATMLIISILMYMLFIDVILPWILEKDMLDIGLILSVLGGIFLWCWIGETLVSIFRCKKFFNNL